MASLLSQWKHLITFQRQSCFTKLPSGIRQFSSSSKIFPFQEIVEERKPRCDGITQEIIKKVNTEITTKTHGRLFAVVMIYGRQYKITTEDILVLQDPFEPKIGECLRLDKVMLVGSPNFTLLGRPLLSKDLVKIEATVIEKTLSHTIMRFYFKKRKRFQRRKFQRYPFTMLRINSININGLVNEKTDVEGLEDRIVG